MARKRINPVLANGGALGTDSPISPSSSGAMDSLLEKLRAAAPQARDQRDRRRRLRLKERHQVRIASGQKMPELSATGEINTEGDDKGDHATNSDGGLLTPKSPGEDGNASGQEISESEDIADRAASMLQGLRGNSDTDSLRTRRRGSAEDERRQRRLRRRNGAASSTKDGADGSALTSVQEPPSPARTDPAETDDSGLLSPNKDQESSSQPPPTPSIIVSPTVDVSPADEPESVGNSPPTQPAEPSE